MFMKTNFKNMKHCQKIRVRFSELFLTCDQAFFFGGGERKREKGEGKKLRLVHLFDKMPTAP